MSRNSKKRNEWNHQFEFCSSRKFSNCYKGNSLSIKLRDTHLTCNTMACPKAKKKDKKIYPYQLFSMVECSFFALDATKYMLMSYGLFTYHPCIYFTYIIHFHCICCFIEL